jgi:hypothetical protein
MECPRCGFQQPEDEFCAQCGVHIGHALRKRRRSNAVALGGTLVLVGAGAVALTVWWSDGKRSADPSLSTTVPDRSSIHRIEPAPPPPPAPQATPKAQKPPPSAAAATEKKGSKTSVPPQPAAADASPRKGPVTPPSGATSETQPQEGELESQLRRWAAQEWVTKGKEQAESPEQELTLYRKAIEVDPHYAPAYYQIALFYGLAGDREAALEALRRFWEDATPEERVSLPLPDGVAPEDLAAPPSGEPEKK